MTTSYHRLAGPGLLQHLASIAPVRERLGGSPADWSAREVSDGNLNTVHLVEGPRDGVCVKQSLPHVRVDPSWRMPLDRTLFEARYLATVAPHVGTAAPALLHLDADLFCLVTERLSPYGVLRQGLIGRTAYPRMATDVADYVAGACFATSGFALPFEAMAGLAAGFGANTTLTRITVDLVMTDPFLRHPRNRWTPGLDAAAAEIAGDPALSAAAARLRRRFLCSPQALLHGDLHTGSVMVTETDTRIIDGEFATMGPIGFDGGLFAANLLLAWCAQPGHADTDDAAPYQTWILAQLERFWSRFADSFGRLMRSPAAVGDLSLAAGAWPEAIRDAEIERVLASVFADLVGFAGLEMIRRVVGYAHVAELETIADPTRRATCERVALRVARTLLLQPDRFRAIGDVTALARACGDAASEQPPSS